MGGAVAPARNFSRCRPFSGSNAAPCQSAPPTEPGFWTVPRVVPVTAVAISDGFFPTLGARIEGRNFTPAEMSKDARVVILSHAFWKRRFHADPAIAGKTIKPVLMHKH